MIGWYHQLNGHEFEQTLGDSEGQRKPGVLQSMRLKRVICDLVTKQQKKLIYNVELVSDVQQSESVIYIASLFFFFFLDYFPQFDEF